MPMRKTKSIMKQMDSLANEPITPPHALTKDPHALWDEARRYALDQAHAEQRPRGCSIGAATAPWPTESERDSDEMRTCGSHLRLDLESVPLWKFFYEQPL